MFKTNKSKGFTLMELLIVIAIIVVLIAIAIPVMGKQLEKAREATDAANIRSAYAEIMVNALTDETPITMDVSLTQTKEDWQNGDIVTSLQKTFGDTTISVKGPKEGGTATVAYDKDKDKATLTFN